MMDGISGNQAPHENDSQFVSQYPRNGRLVDHSSINTKKIKLAYLLLQFFLHI
jgi:hypothetical protein